MIENKWSVLFPIWSLRFAWVQFGLVQFASVQLSSGQLNSSSSSSVVEPLTEEWQAGANDHRQSPAIAHHNRADAPWANSQLGHEAGSVTDTVFHAPSVALAP